MKIHFVCTGNTFRSRIAEAYLKSKNIPDLIISSSGIKAYKNLNGSVCENTIEELKKHNLIEFLSKSWTQTTKEDIENQDLVVFMEDIHYKFCRDNLRCNINNYQIWDVEDVPDKLTEMVPKPIEEILIISEKIFERIKKHVDVLVDKKIL